MKIRTTKEKRKLIVKTIIRWVLYLFLILICFSFMMAGTLKKPVFLIPVAICIAMNTGELQSAFSGAFCGLLIDIACNRLFGYNAFILTVICTFTSLLFIHCLRPKFLNFLFITAISSFISGLLDYRFYYNIWNYDNVNSVFTNFTIPIFIYTLISAVPIYLIIYLINKFLMPKRHLSIAEAIKTQE